MRWKKVLKTYARNVLKMRLNYVRNALIMRRNFEFSAHFQNFSAFSAFRTSFQRISYKIMRWHLDPGYIRNPWKWSNCLLTIIEGLSVNVILKGCRGSQVVAWRKLNNYFKDFLLNQSYRIKSLLLSRVYFPFLSLLILREFLKARLCW